MYLVCINVVFKVQKIEEHITIKVVQWKHNLNVDPFPFGC
jgi:hypothetical protein